LSLKFKRMKSVGGWTYKEIAAESGIPPQRLSEYVNHDKYQKAIQEKHLANIVSAGFISAHTLKRDLISAGIEMDDESIQYVDIACGVRGQGQPSDQNAACGE